MNSINDTLGFLGLVRDYDDFRRRKVMSSENFDKYNVDFHNTPFYKLAGEYSPSIVRKMGDGGEDGPIYDGGTLDTVTKVGYPSSYTPEQIREAERQRKHDEARQRRIDLRRGITDPDPTYAADQRIAEQFANYDTKEARKIVDKKNKRLNNWFGENIIKRARYQRDPNASTSWERDKYSEYMSGKPTSQNYDDYKTGSTGELLDYIEGNASDSKIYSMLNSRVNNDDMWGRYIPEKSAKIERAAKFINSLDDDKKKALLSTDFSKIKSVNDAIDLVKKTGLGMEAVKLLPAIMEVKSNWDNGYTYKDGGPKKPQVKVSVNPSEGERTVSGSYSTPQYSVSGYVGQDGIHHETTEPDGFTHPDYSPGWGAGVRYDNKKWGVGVSGKYADGRAGATISIRKQIGK